MSWEAIAAIVGIVSAANAIVVGPALGVLKWFLEKSLESRAEAIDAEFARLEDRIENVGSLREQVMTLREKVTREYVHREDWVRIEGGRDVSMRHLREDVTELKTSVAEIRQRLHKDQYQQNSP
jgi:hypothetical protein